MEGLTSLHGIWAFYCIVLPGSRVPHDRVVGRGVPPSRRMESRHLGGLMGRVALLRDRRMGNRPETACDYGAEQSRLTESSRLLHLMPYDNLF